MTSRDELRREWFDISSGALDFTLHVLVEDGAPGPHYACPLCWKFFDAEELEGPDPTLTIEDVPPVALGGAPMVLTCKVCNNTGGSKVDADAREHDRIKRALAGEGERIRLRIDGGVTAELELGPEGEHLYYFDPQRSNPDVYGRLIERLEGATEGQEQHLFEAEFRLGYSPADSALSYLRAAYLVVFAQYGYRAVLADAFRPIRRVLRDLDAGALELPILKAIPGYAQSWFGAQHERLGAVLIVSFERCAVILPDPLAHTESWWDLVPDVTPKSEIDIEASLPWPTGPAHVLDLQMPKAEEPVATEEIVLFGD